VKGKQKKLYLSLIKYQAINVYVGVEVQLHALDGGVWSPWSNDPRYPVNVGTGMRRITTFRSKERIYGGVPSVWSI